ncbi:MAG: DUF2914 domain-containing protein [Gammaproteobacteria bacterium]|nr:DUF2914 domain-containing protein [Gammaproteobacteria bacterium]
MIKQLITAVTLSLVVLGFSAQASAEGSVARAAFAQSIVDREPVDQLTELTNDNSKIYFFTDLRGLKDQSVTHRWEYAGEPHATVTFNVGANRWRVWSSKNLQTDWTGTWTVSVIDEEGNVLSEENFNYVEAE